LSTTENTIYPNEFKGYVFLWYRSYTRAVDTYLVNVTTVTFPNYRTGSFILVKIPVLMVLVVVLVTVVIH
jgi:hypothetical protein